MITGINHITLSVKNLDESFHFYEKILGFNPVLKWPEGAYLTTLQNDWLALILDKETREQALPEYTHIAFTVEKGQFETFQRRIMDTGIAIWQENQSEGLSLYFLDPNGHKLEIHASDLASRIEAKKKQTGVIVFQ